MNKILKNRYEGPEIIFITLVMSWIPIMIKPDISAMGALAWGAVLFLVLDRII